MKIYKKLFMSVLVVGAFLVFIGNAQAATLSQTSVTLYQGQSSTVYASNVSTYLYLSNNSNQSVASVSVSGNNINIYALANGNTIATICENGTGVCNAINITVTGNYYVGGGYYSTYNSYNSYNSGLSVSSLTLSVGSAATISSLNSTGLSVSNNSNPSVATVSNSSITPGCTANSLYSVLTGQPCYNNQTNNSGSYYYSSSSSYTPGCYANSQYSVLTGQPCYNNQMNNSNIGSSVQILAVAAGSDTITFCQSNNATCSVIYVTVY